MAWRQRWIGKEALKDPGRSSGRGKAIQCIALLGGIFSCLISAASHPISVTAFMPEMSPRKQHLESGHILSLERHITLVKKIMAPSSNPRACILTGEQQYKSAIEPLCGCSMAENLALGIRRARCMLDGEALGLAVVADSKEMGNEPTERGKQQKPQGVWGKVNQAAWFAILVGGGYGFILMIRDGWRAMTPNEKVSDAAEPHSLHRLVRHWTFR